VVNAPFGVGFSPEGNTAYISTGDGVIISLDTTTLKTNTTYKVGSGPVNVLVSSNGRWVITENYGDGAVSEIDTATGKVTSIPPPAGANGAHGLMFIN
jgi:DNA-binding beta-propeller fold protein YncE